jgi:hypothetical protein
MSLVGQVRSAFFKGGDIDGYRRICWVDFQRK